LPSHGPLALVVAQVRLLVGVLPVDHRLVELAAEQERVEVAELVEYVGEQLGIGRTPRVIPVDIGDEPVEGCAHPIDHAAHGSLLALRTSCCADRRAARNSSVALRLTVSLPLQLQPPRVVPHALRIAYPVDLVNRDRSLGAEFLQRLE